MIYSWDLFLCQPPHGFDNPWFDIGIVRPRVRVTLSRIHSTSQPFFIKVSCRLCYLNGEVLAL
jgi:hypothetical protein